MKINRPNHIDCIKAESEGFHRVTHKGVKYMKGPKCWQTYSDVDKAYVNGMPYSLEEELERAFQLMQNLIHDELELKGAKTKFGSDIKIFDNGFGLLYVNRDSMGIIGISRSQSWEEAYETAEDEFFQRATHEEILADFPNYEKTFNNGESDTAFDESYGFSPNNGMYHKDLNGDSCDLLTNELLKELEMSVSVGEYD